MRLTDEILAYIDRIRADERERCAKVAEEIPAHEADWTSAQAIARAIRALGAPSDATRQQPPSPTN